MSDLLQRRGFLRALATLPLIGGGVTLIGNPTRAACRSRVSFRTDTSPGWRMNMRRRCSNVTRLSRSTMTFNAAWPIGTTRDCTPQCTGFPRRQT
jgi:hypothetical protein